MCTLNPMPDVRVFAPLVYQYEKQCLGVYLGVYLGVLDICSANVQVFAKAAEIIPGFIPLANYDLCKVYGTQNSLCIEKRQILYTRTTNGVQI